MPDIVQNYEMNAKPDEVWEALVTPDIIQIWSGDEAKMSENIGFEWSMWGGQMFGKNIEVIPNKKLVQDWCYHLWDKDRPTKVTFTIKPKGKGSVVELLHQGVPDKSLKSITEGWDTYYLGAMQEMFEEKAKKEAQKKK